LTITIQESITCNFLLLQLLQPIVKTISVRIQQIKKIVKNPRNINEEIDSYYTIPEGPIKMIFLYFRISNTYGQPGKQYDKLLTFCRSTALYLYRDTREPVFKLDRKYVFVPDPYSKGGSADTFSYGSGPCKSTFLFADMRKDINRLGNIRNDITFNVVLSSFVELTSLAFVLYNDLKKINNRNNVFLIAKNALNFPNRCCTISAEELYNGIKNYVDFSKRDTSPCQALYQIFF
jgi:hypothetical protein